jgi:rhodanese-related sulfurtransferase
MMLKNPYAQAAILIGAGLVFAIVTNGFASPQRRLVLNAYYPNALKVPERRPETPPPLAPAQPAAPVTTATIVPVASEDPAAATTTTIAPVTTTSATTSPVPASVAAVTSATPASPPPPPKPAADPLARFQPHPNEAAVELGGEDVMTLHRAGALFLDARRTSVYEEGHIAGARSFSVWEADIDDKVNALFAERDEPAEQNLPIVIYCSGGACEDSHMLAQKLWGIQFNNVYVYKDGYPDWQKRGGAVRTGAQP